MIFDEVSATFSKIHIRFGELNFRLIWFERDWGFHFYWQSFHVLFVDPCLVKRMEVDEPKHIVKFEGFGCLFFSLLGRNILSAVT